MPDRSSPPEYDTKEADEIFRRAHADRDPGVHYEDREAAARNLLSTLLEVAKGAGYEVGTDHGVPVIAQRHRGAVHFRLDDDKLLMAPASPGREPAWQPPNNIVYDGARRIFVEQELAGDGKLVPGRGSAVATLAKQVVRLIKDQAEARQADAIRNNKPF